MQGVSNIITDVVYIVAPIIYLSTVQLSSRTQWGLRLVFCLGLMYVSTPFSLLAPSLSSPTQLTPPSATICSIFKTVELRVLQKTRDPTWDGVNLTIWSATELSVGILVASLPPLRKQFEKLLRRVLPSTWQTSKERTPGSRSGIPMYNVSKVSKQNTKIMGRSDIGIDDGDSERSILSDGGEGKMDGGIMKTVVHEVRSEERGNSVAGSGELDGVNNSFEQQRRVR